jgi:hypothetical protein
MAWDDLTPIRARALRAELYALRRVYAMSGRRVQLLVKTALPAIADAAARSHSIAEKLAGRPGRPAPRGVVVKSVELTDDQVDLLRRIMLDEEAHYRALPGITHEMALIYAVALFEGLISDAHSTALRRVPAKLKLGRQLTYETALQFGTRAALIDDLARRATRDFTAQSMDKQLESLESNFGIELLAQASVDNAVLTRILMRRNLFVHNNGIVTPEYVAAIRDDARVGMRIAVDAGELTASQEVLQKLGDGLIDGLVTNLCAKAGPISAAEVKLLLE